MPKLLPILGKIFSKERDDGEPLLALELSEDKKIKVALWQIKKGKHKIFQKAFEQYEGDWEEIILKVKQLVEELIEKVELEKKPKKVVFGLPKAFVSEDKIKSSHQETLKTFCQHLLLSPLGFVEISQAIAFLLKEEQGYPLTAILLRVGKFSFTFNIFKIGREIGSQTVLYKDHLARNLSQALQGFEELQTLPAKIFLYDGKESLEEIKEELLSHPWQKEAGFLHFPQIEILEEDFSLKGLVAAGASEFKIKEISSFAAQEEILEEASDKKAVFSQELGFLKDEDVAEKKRPVAEEKKEEREAVRKLVEEEEEAVTFKEEKKLLKPKPNLFSSFGQTLYQKINSFFESFSYRLDFKRISLLLIFVGFALSAFLFYSYWLSPQATLKLLVEPYTLEEDAAVILNLSQEKPDTNFSQIPGRELTIERKTADKITVTSKKEVGEPGRGEVTVYNKTTNKKTFSEGTVLIGPKGLKFTLDKEVSVASLSDVIAGTPGKEKVKVTAVEIGPEGNLGVGSDFTFKDLPVTLYAARNEQAFSGGSSREVTVVGEKDQDDLLKRLQDRLTNQAKEGFEEKLGGTEKILTETIEGKILEKKFDHEVGDETDELFLDLAMSFKAVVYDEDDLGNLLKKMAEEKAPKGFKFEKHEVEMEVTSMEKEKDEISFNAHFKVKLIPEIDVTELKEKITGRKSDKVEEYLRTQGNLAGFEIEFSSHPPFMKNTLPFNPQKISIEIQTL